MEEKTVKPNHTGNYYFEDNKNILINFETPVLKLII